MKPAHVPGTSLGSLYDMQIRVPNITGKVMVGGYQLMTSKHTGAFFGSDYGTADYHGQDGRQNVPTTFGIDASRSSAVYGRSSTVQPASTHMLLCIKT